MRHFVVAVAQAAEEIVADIEAVVVGLNLCQDFFPLVGLDLV